MRETRCSTTQAYPARLLSQPPTIKERRPDFDRVNYCANQADHGIWVWSGVFDSPGSSAVTAVC